MFKTQIPLHLDYAKQILNIRQFEMIKNPTAHIAMPTKLGQTWLKAATTLNTAIQKLRVIAQLLRITVR